MALKLTDIEISALEFLSQNDGCVLTSEVSDTNYKDWHGDTVAGKRVYNRLCKMGLVGITEEDEDEDGFEWTPSYYLEDAALEYLK